MPNWGSSCCIGSCTGGAVVCLAMMCVGIMEKARFTPFYEDLKCDTPPVAIRLSGISAPSPLAEALGSAPGTPPFGLFLDMTTKVKCKNPNQAGITMLAKDSHFELFQPNLTDLALGGPGKPYATLSLGKLRRDAVFPSGGGEGEMVQDTAVSIPLADLLAISAVASVQGYAPQYMKSSVTIENRVTMFGMPLATETVSEQWCGYFGGNCLAKTLDSNGNPVLDSNGTPQLEPALCAMTAIVCSETVEDMKASLDWTALGGKVVATAPCPPSTGLPSTTMCNLVTAPGVDSVTLEPVALGDPKLTPKAQEEFDKKIADAEAMVHGMLSAVIGSNAVLFVVFGTMAVFNCYRRARSARAGAPAESPPNVAGVPTILADSARAGAQPTKVSV